MYFQQIWMIRLNNRDLVHLSEKFSDGS